MRILVQRSLKSKVSVLGEVVGKIDKGLVLLVGFTDGDSMTTIDYMINKVLHLRIFDDENGVMNKSILDVGGSILSISQFTLYADCKKGNRPSYVKALNGIKAIELYKIFNERMREFVHVEEGVFGAEMLVDIQNDGPVTIWIEKGDDGDKK